MPQVPGSFAACSFTAVGTSRAIEEEAIVALGAMLTMAIMIALAISCHHDMLYI